MINKFLLYCKKTGAFGVGVFVGVVYGSVVSTITCAMMLGVP